MAAGCGPRRGGAAVALVVLALALAATAEDDGGGLSQSTVRSLSQLPKKGKRPNFLVSASW
jgi:hypothetical protein